VEASGTVFGEVVRQRQLALTTNLVSPSVQQHSLLFPLIPDFPSSLGRFFFFFFGFFFLDIF